MVNLKALEKSLAKIEEVGKDELAFEANGVKLVLRTLQPDEEEIVDAYARLAYTRPLSDFDIPEDEFEKDEDDDDEETDPLDIVRHRIWLDRLRQATLGFVIVELDGQNMRGLQYVETGDVDANGKPEAMLKHEALRELVARWTRPVLTQMFGAFSELMDRVNLRASKLVQFKPADIEEELRRLKQRIVELERHKLFSEDPSLRSSGEVTSQDEAEEANATRRHQMGALADMTEQAQQQAQQQAPQTDRVPQTDRLPPQRQETFQQEQAPVPPQEPERPPGYVPPPLEGDSRFDPSDPDAALAAENARQEILYRQQQERKRQQEEAAQQGQARKPILQGQAVRPQAKPAGAVSLQGESLREARNTANVAQAHHGQTPTRQGTRKVGGKDIPIYKQPTVTMERRGQQPDPSQIQIDQGSSSRNPRFVGPRGNND
jgi:hypothetical protein